MKVENGDVARCLRVTEIPTGATQLRTVINGVPTYAATLDGGAPSAVVDAADLLSDVPAAQRARFPRTAPVTVVAYDADGVALDRCDVQDCLLTPHSAAGARGAAGAPPDGDGDAGGRLLATSLLAAAPGHTWTFAPARDAAAGTLYRVTFRADASLEAGHVPLATVTWSVYATPLATADPAAKRARRGVPDAAWGDCLSIGHIGNGCVHSCFLAPPVTDDVSVRCAVTWIADPAARPAALWYAVHGRVLPPLGDAAPPPGAVSGARAAAAPQKRAVIVGVSKYSRRPRPRSADLEWCDEDATTWYEHLTQLGYACQIFGDEFSPYPRWDGPATVRNVRAAVQAMAAAANTEADRVVFVDSSHGNGDGQGNSYLCLLPDAEDADPDIHSGSYWDHQLAKDLSSGGANRARAFVFLDACYSGGTTPCAGGGGGCYSSVRVKFHRNTAWRRFSWS
jgi:hypothetical protein